MFYYIYMVRCADGSHYTGITSHLNRRMHQHVEKLPECARYTRTHPVIALDGLWRAPDRSAALRLEYAIKQLRRREKLCLLENPEELGKFFPQLKETDYVHVPGVTLEMCLRGEFGDGN